MDHRAIRHCSSSGKTDVAPCLPDASLQKPLHRLKRTRLTELDIGKVWTLCLVVFAPCHAPSFDSASPGLLHSPTPLRRARYSY